jgi:glyoxylase-like metal-dependent hydrolase (beta-lactamase superfamily II)
MMRSAFVAIVLTMLGSTAEASGIDRLYVIDCGWAHAADQSRWSPGVNVGVPIDLSDNCYLIHHDREGYLLWDTGIGDSVADLPNGLLVKAINQTWHRTQTLSAALATIGVQPADIRYVGLSHIHPDHSGNVDEFPDATLVIQKAEWEFAKTQALPFNPNRKLELLDGDKDLFGDGSVRLLSTPGHTPGHQSLLLHLDKTGYVVLSGDLVHLKANWDNRQVPVFNADREQSVASMDKIARVIEEKHAQFWINHDKPSSDALRHSPAFYE